MQRDRFAQLVQDSANGSTSGAETSDTASTSKKRKERGPVEPFDYSSVPNILDDEPVPQQEPKQKKQKKNKEKGAARRSRCGLRWTLIAFSFHVGMDPSSNFPPTPKARNEPKSGNKSVTFK
jgi:exosome complex exonuclease RRP6